MEKNREIERMRNSQAEVEVARLEIENRNLMRTVKELQGRVNKGKSGVEASFSKETEDLKGKLKTREQESEEMLQKIKRLQVFYFYQKLKN